MFLELTSFPGFLHSLQKLKRFLGERETFFLLRTLLVNLRFILARKSPENEVGSVADKYLFLLLTQENFPFPSSFVDTPVCGRIDHYFGKTF